MTEYQSADVGDARIGWLEEGEGESVLLIHGFASSGLVNWAGSGWLQQIAGAGRRAIAVDNRGHGISTKFHRPADYRVPLMANDMLRLLDHLRIERAAVVGYSMGSRIGAVLAADHPERISALVMGGMGETLLGGNPEREAIAAGLELPALSDVAGATPRLFRRFAERTGNDLGALAACMRGQGGGVTLDALASIRVPTLLALGADDTLAGSALPLAERIADSELLLVDGADHMFAPGKAAFKAGVLDFLRRRS